MTTIQPFGQMPLQSKNSKIAKPLLQFGRLMTGDEVELSQEAYQQQKPKNLLSKLIHIATAPLRWIKNALVGVKNFLGRLIFGKKQQPDLQAENTGSISVERMPSTREPVDEKFFKIIADAVHNLPPELDNILERYNTKVRVFKDAHEFEKLMTNNPEAEANPDIDFCNVLYDMGHTESGEEELQINLFQEWNPGTTEPMDKWDDKMENIIGKHPTPLIQSFPRKGDVEHTIVLTIGNLVDNLLFRKGYISSEHQNFKIGVYSDIRDSFQGRDITPLLEAGLIRQAGNDGFSPEESQPYDPMMNDMQGEEHQVKPFTFNSQDIFKAVFSAQFGLGFGGMSARAINQTFPRVRQVMHSYVLPNLYEL